MSFNALIAVLALLALIGMIAALRQLIQLALVLAENRLSPEDRRRRGPRSADSPGTASRPVRVRR